MGSLRRRPVLPSFSSNSLTTIQVSTNDETPISPLVSFWAFSDKIREKFKLSHPVENRLGHVIGADRP
jgi:hypothetical protein